MRYHALACDFDGTLAWNGHVDATTIHALGRLRRSGRKLILVTGRELDDLIDIFPNLDLFDRVVAENGGIVYRPESNDQRVLGDPPPAAFVESLYKRGVGPISIGEVVVATWHPHEAAVLDAIKQHGLEHHVVFNKGAVMVLPSGVNKASGLLSALYELHISPRNAVSIGDAENDQTMFLATEAAVAVDNALTTVKMNADLVSDGHHGSGVVEIIERLIEDDLASAAPSLHRLNVVLGCKADGTPIVIPPYDSRVLIAGAPARGKSTLATGIIERLTARGYQVCVIDPEGDYGTIPDIIHIGDGQQPPSVDELAQLLEYPTHSVVANLLALPAYERPAFLATLCAAMKDLLQRFGRPHWFVIDEAHHLLPQHVTTTCTDSFATLPGLVLVTVDPRHFAADAARAVSTFVSVDIRPSETLEAFSDVTGRDLPNVEIDELAFGEGVIWEIDRLTPPVRFRALPCRSRHLRHRRKYAEGDMGWERSFYFTGPTGQPRRRAQNLITFMDIGDDVDDDTWGYHANRGDFSRWVSDAIGDTDLANRIADIEAQHQTSVAERRTLTRREIEKRYTLPP